MILRHSSTRKKTQTNIIRWRYTVCTAISWSVILPAHYVRDYMWSRTKKNGFIYVVPLLVSSCLSRAVYIWWWFLKLKIKGVCFKRDIILLKLWRNCLDLMYMLIKLNSQEPMYDSCWYCLTISNAIRLDPFPEHYSDVVMGTMASQITRLTIVYSIVYKGVDQRKHQSSPSLAFVWEIHRWPVNSPHKWPVT